MHDVGEGSNLVAPMDVSLSHILVKLKGTSIYSTHGLIVSAYPPLNDSCRPPAKGLVTLLQHTLYAVLSWMSIRYLSILSY